MTVSAIVLGEAPGYCPETTTVGGTISGYSLMGSRGSPKYPATRMMIEITEAKMGRSMKNEEMLTEHPPARGFAMTWSQRFLENQAARAAKHCWYPWARASA